VLPPSIMRTLALATCLASGVSALHLPTVGAPHIRSAPPSMAEVAPKKKAQLVEDLAPMTQTEVFECQKKWAAAIAGCSKVYAEGGDYIGAAADAASELYGYGFLPEVLFKPTKAADVPYRPTASEAMSYFVGGDVVDGGYEEDSGFAINGGKGWEKVVFTNHAISLNGPSATAMGYYIFTDATNKQEVKVEYTFGYKRCSDGKPRIYLHHSSVPFQKASSGQSLLLAPLTEAEVIQCQTKWAAAIASITKTYFDKGDFIGAAGEAAGELYGYGFGDVLFKPTKASDVPFRPTPNEAMSYFVGGSNVDNGYDEDAGFAINGGKGWSQVVFNNHNIELLGTTAIAMGYYVFTDATTTDEVTVEYTFGYKRCSDGKPRIFLHHSSVPYSGGGSDSRDSWLARAKEFRENMPTATISEDDFWEPDEEELAVA